MTPRKRLLKAFNFEEVRPTPYTIWFDHQTMEKLNSYYGGTAWREHIEDHILRIIVKWEPKEILGDGLYRDIHGSIWQSGEPAHIVKPALELPSVRGFSIPDYIPFLRNSKTPSTTQHEQLPSLGYEDARRKIEAEKENRLVILQYGFGLFECGWMMRGYENLFVDLLEEPYFCHQLFDMLLERHLQIVDALLELPCDGIIFVDDYGDQRGVIVGPELWRRFIAPRLSKLYERVHRSGRLVFQHSCGNVFDIVPDLIACGLDVLQSLQPEAMPIYELKKLYGKDLRFWGGLGTQRLLPMGTPDEIRSEVRRLRREMGAGGGYCFSSSKPIMKDVPVENAAAFIEETLSCGF